MLDLCCCWAFLWLWRAGSTLELQAQASQGGLSCGAQAPRSWASAAAAPGLWSHRLNSCGARAQLFHGLWDPPGLGLNVCLLHRQVDSPPLGQQGNLLIYDSHN